MIECYLNDGPVNEWTSQRVVRRVGYEIKNKQIIMVKIKIDVVFMTRDVGSHYWTHVTWHHEGHSSGRMWCGN